ncbi:MAG: hypothetical protein HUU28_04405 [Planctomycetaceae bacterium]|nr:hypothetical protein [Planctomycetaceae bacterium]
MKLLPFLAWVLTLLFVAVGYWLVPQGRCGEVVSLARIEGGVDVAHGSVSEWRFDWANWDARRGVGFVCIDWSESEDFRVSLRRGCGLRFRLVGRYYDEEFDACVDGTGDPTDWFYWHAGRSEGPGQLLTKAFPLAGCDMTLEVELVAHEADAEVPSYPVHLKLAIVGELDGDWTESNSVGRAIGAFAALAVAAGSTFLFLASLSPAVTDTERTLPS